ncbi:MAG: response regulator transcription factor [Nitrospirae bacterium]|nr:response regulator transcription factor [Nitrospirota bacterium]
MKASKNPMGQRRNTKSITLFVADDHAILRSGLRMLLESQPDMTVVGEASNGIDTIKKARKLNPKIVLLDITMPNMKISETIKTIRRECPSTKVLILTMHEDSAYLKKVLNAGASGYVCKRVADTELLTAIRAVQDGRMFVNLHVEERGRESTPTQLSSHQQRRSEHEELPLSRREKEVLLLVAKGYTSQEIGTQLVLSIKSIETYRSRLMEKLKLKSRAELVRYVMDRELLTPQ